MYENKEKIFLVINLSCLGDVVLTNYLCQNLKIEYPDSKIVFITDKPFFQAAKYQFGVDEVFVFDKRNSNKGLMGLLNFVSTFKYKNQIFASFIIYGNFRGILLSFLLKSKIRISSPTKHIKYLLTDVITETPDFVPISDVMNYYFKAFAKKDALKIPVKFNVSPHNNKIASALKNQYNNLISFNPISEEAEKNMPISTAVEIINILNKENKTVVFLGKGIEAKTYAENLKKLGCIKFVDLTDSTSIYDLANILSVSQGTISIDTGTMHLSYAVKTPTVCVFYKKSNVSKWAPNTDLYNVYVEDNDFSAENICSKLNQIITI